MDNVERFTRLDELADVRAELMERIQAIDDEAAELLPEAQRAHRLAVNEANDRAAAFDSTWGHLQPLKPKSFGLL